MPKYNDYSSPYNRYEDFNPLEVEVEEDKTNIGQVSPGNTNLPTVEATTSRNIDIGPHLGKQDEEASLKEEEVNVPSSFPSY